MQKRIDEIVNHEPLTLAQVDRLSLHICRYVLPLNQAKSKRHVLIFYSEENRKGAISEANNMRESLKVYVFVFHYLKVKVEGRPHQT